MPPFEINSTKMMRKCILTNVCTSVLSLNMKINKLFSWNIFQFNDESNLFKNCLRFTTNVWNSCKINRNSVRMHPFQMLTTTDDDFAFIYDTFRKLLYVNIFPESVKNYSFACACIRKVQSVRLQLHTWSHCNNIFSIFLFKSFFLMCEFSSKKGKLKTVFMLLMRTKYRYTLPSSRISMLPFIPFNLFFKFSRFRSFAEKTSWSFLFIISFLVFLRFIILIWFCFVDCK